MSPTALADIAAGFGQRLHAAGVPVTPERSARFARVIALAGSVAKTDVYWLGRTTLVSGRDQIETFDRVFRQVFEGIFELADLRTDDQQLPVPARESVGDAPGQEGSDGFAEPGDAPTTVTPGQGVESDDSAEARPLAAVSDRERLGHRNFADCTPEELALLARLAEHLPVVPPPRRARRLTRRDRGSRIDVRATLRQSHRTGGDPVDIVTRAHSDQPRRVVLIADVSGSMEPYARVYLHLMRGAVRALRAEAFVFATRLTRLTRPLAESQPDRAYRRAVESAPDWSGGTRIGRALTAFLDDYGRRGVARGAIIVIVSDGWEIEDPALVGVAMERLGRLAHSIVWVNPRKAAEGYEPLAGGMAAALPHVDTFVSGHSFHALEDVMAAIRSARRRTTHRVAS